MFFHVHPGCICSYPQICHESHRELVCYCNLPWVHQVLSSWGSSLHALLQGCFWRSQCICRETSFANPPNFYLYIYYVMSISYLDILKLYKVITGLYFAVFCPFHKTKAMFEFDTIIFWGLNLIASWWSCKYKRTTTDQAWPSLSSTGCVEFGSI